MRRSLAIAAAAGVVLLALVVTWQSRQTPPTDAPPGLDIAQTTPSPTPAPAPSPTAVPTPEPEPPPAAPPPPPPPVTPVRVRIPRINVDARIVPVGVNRYGEMETPYDPWIVAWYAPGYKPMEEGNAVLAAHVDYVNVGPAIFYNLKSLTPGDQVSVVGDDGAELFFEVKEIQRYRPEDAPLERIFGSNSNRGLNLVTCGGVFNTRTREYDERVVVFTEAIVPIASPTQSG